MNLLEHRLKKQGINPGLKQGWNEQQFCIDQTLPDQSLLTSWKEEYELSIIMFHDILEQIRENVLSEHYEYRSCHEDIEKKVMQCAYRIHHGGA